jgi:hypothetical protein
LDAEPGGEPLGVDVRGVVGAELGHDPAEDTAVRAAGAGLLGSGQRGEVGIDGAAEGDVTSGVGDAVDRCHSLGVSELMGHYL